MKHTTVLFSLVLFFIFSQILCIVPVRGQETPNTESEAVILARVGDWTLTKDDLVRIVGYYPKEKREYILKNPRNLITLVNRLVKIRILSDRAYSEKLDLRRDIKEQIELNERDKLAQAYIQEKLLGTLSVSDEDCKLYYRSHKKEYKTPPKVHARHILIRMSKDPEDSEVELTRKKAEEILERLKSGEDFGILAASLSEDPGSRARGGDLGWISRGKLDPSFAKAAFAAKKGEIVGPVRSAYGFHIIKVEDRKPARQLPYEKVKERIRTELLKRMRENKVKEFIDAALKESGATVNKDRIVDMTLE